MSKAIEDLAILGGSPAFDSPLHVNAPSTGAFEAFLGYSKQAWDRNWFTNEGPLSTELTSRLEKKLNVPHCVLTSSGTSAMTLLVAALELEGEVILPSFTFVSTAHALTMAGIRAVFADIDPVSLNIDPDHCEKLVTDHTCAIIATHLWGNACDIAKLEALARRHGIKLIFDAAHAIGCSHQGRPIGGFGDAEVFSFHATKVFHTGEGGAITTRDFALAERLKLMRNFGFSGMDQVEMVGTNAKMSELSAAMGLTNLDVLPQTLEKSEANYLAYKDRLKSVRNLKLHEPDTAEAHNFQYIVLLVEGDQFLTRDAIVDVLCAENVIARRYFYPGSHTMKPYRNRELGDGARLAITESVANRILLLPGGATVSQEDIQTICDLLEKIMANSKAIAQQLDLSPLAI